MTGNALRPFSPRYPMLSLGAVSEAGGSGPARLRLRVVFVNERQWLNIPPGPALGITADGEGFTLSGPGSRDERYVGEDGKLYEVALYEVDAALVRKIARARAVAVALRGDFPLEKSFGSVNTLYFQQFVTHYLDRAPAAGR